jgi:uncharacterized cupin superfamily protein
MPVFTPDQFVTEDTPSKFSPLPDRAHWISEAGGLTQFGALIEGSTETRLGVGDAVTFRAGVPVGHFFENRSASTTR